MSVVKSIGWLAAGRAVAMVTTFLTIAVLSRILSPYEFGLMAAVLVVTSLSDALFEGAFGISITQREVVSKEFISGMLVLAAIIGLLLILVVWISAASFQRLLGFDGIEYILIISSASFLFKAIESVAFSLMRRNRQFRSIALYQFIGQIAVYSPVSIGLALAGYGVWSLAIGNVALTFASCILALYMADIRRESTLDLSVLARSVGTATRDTLSSQNAYFILSQALNWLALNGPNTIIARGLGPVDLGLYSRSWRILDLVSKLTASPIQNVLLSSFSRMQRDVELARSSFIKTLDISLTFFSVISALLIIQAPLLVTLLLGEKWISAVPTVQVLFGVLVARNCVKVTESLAVAFGRSKSAAWRQGLYAGLMIAGSYVGVSYGVIGVALGASIALACFYISSTFYAARLVRASLGEVCLPHVRAVFLFLGVLILDWAIVTSASKYGLVISHILGGASGLFLFMLVINILPKRILGVSLVQIRETAYVKLDRLFK